MVSAQNVQQSQTSTSATTAHGEPSRRPPRTSHVRGRGRGRGRGHGTPSQSGTTSTTPSNPHQTPTTSPLVTPSDPLVTPTATMPGPSSMLSPPLRLRTYRRRSAMSTREQGLSDISEREEYGEGSH